MNIHEYIKEVGIVMEKPTGFLRSDLSWKGDNDKSIQPDLIGEKEVNPGQKVSIGIFNELECFKMIVAISGGDQQIYKESLDTDLLEPDRIHILPR